MKRTFLLFLMLASSVSLQAQYYEHTVKTGEVYQNLTDPTVVYSHPWDYNQTEIINSPITNFYGFENVYPMGFSFFADGRLGIANESYSDFFIISAAYVNLVSRSSGGASDVSWATEGVAPNRISKAQWRNVGLEADLNSFLNFQIWYYESDGAIEIHYGPSSVAEGAYAPYGNPVVGLYSISSGTYSNGYSLTGMPSEPEANEAANAFEISGTPENGTVYKFNNLSINLTSAEEKSEVHFSIYPNPTKDIFHISKEMQEVKVFDLKGRVLQKLSNTTEVNISGLAHGVYLIEMVDYHKTYRKYIVKE